MERGANQLPPPVQPQGPWRRRQSRDSPPGPSHAHPVRSGDDSSASTVDARVRLPPVVLCVRGAGLRPAHHPLPHRLLRLRVAAAVSCRAPARAVAGVQGARRRAVRGALPPPRRRRQFWIQVPHRSRPQGLQRPTHPLPPLPRQAGDGMLCGIYGVQAGGRLPDRSEHGCSAEERGGDPEAAQHPERHVPRHLPRPQCRPALGRKRRRLAVAARDDLKSESGVFLRGSRATMSCVGELRTAEL
mmetsp:Transcript_20374/g.41135  ORF Transcript_20374/g.41135 Transcript_20374/m.41135 type:complete len:244 (-) Transcript_20374:39-770(-)